MSVETKLAEAWPDMRNLSAPLDASAEKEYVLQAGIYVL